MSDEKFIDSPPEGLEGWRDVWARDLRNREELELTAKDRIRLRVLRRAIDIVLEPLLARQRDFNLSVLDLLAGIRRDLTDVDRDVKRLSESLSAAEHRIDAKLITGIQRNDALLGAIDQKIETVAVRLRDATNPLVEHVSTELRDDLLYRRLEDGLRGSEAQVRDSLDHYVELASAHQPVIDVGCGRGEFLESCRARKVEARGFDTNERSVADLKQRGLAVILGGVPGCFSGIEDGSVGSILASHVVEHLPVETLFELFAQARRVLVSGGLLMIETPNAQSLLVGASEFWRDPTHIAPRHVGSLTRIARELGFSVEEVRTLHPQPDDRKLSVDSSRDRDILDVVDRLNEILFGDQDLRLVLKKG